MGIPLCFSMIFFSPISDPHCQGFVANFPLLQTITKPGATGPIGVPGAAATWGNRGVSDIRGRSYHEDPPKKTWGNAGYLKKKKKIAMKPWNPLGISVKKFAGYLSIPRPVFLVMIKCWFFGICLRYSPWVSYVGILFIISSLFLMYFLVYYSDW